MADTAAALLLSISADVSQLKKGMAQAVGIHASAVKQMKAQQNDLQRALADFSGVTSLKSALLGLTAAGVVGGMADMVKKSLDAASAIGDVARQSGVSTDTLQKLRFAASQSGASFDILDQGLTVLNKNFGDFVNTGAGRAAAAFKQLGIDKLINNGDVRNSEQAFDAIVTALQSVGSEAQKSALVTHLFGQEAGPKLLQFVEQGTAGIAALEAQAQSLGIVLSGDTVKSAKEADDKLSALFNVIKAEGISAVAGLAPQIADLAQHITKSLPDLITYVEKWAAWFGLIKLSPAEKLAGEIQDVQSKLKELEDKRNDTGGLQGVLNSISTGGLDAQIAETTKKLAALQAQKPALNPAIIGGASDPFEHPAPPKLAVGQTPQEIALAQKRKQLLAQTGVDAATASAALIVAQDQTNVQLLKGSADYYAAVQKQINDEYNAKVTTAEAEADKEKAALAKNGTDWKGYADGVANINEALTDKIAAAAEEQKQKLFDAGPAGLVQAALIQGKQQIQNYTDQTAALGLTAGALAKLTYVQAAQNAAADKDITLSATQNAQIEAEGNAIGKAADAADKTARASQTNIQFADSLRTGLEEVGAAGVKGFGSLKDAAASFLEQIAEMIVQLYVMKPLVEGILGPSGSSLKISGGGGGGGGILSGIGSIFDSIFNFADGGPVRGKGGPRSDSNLIRASNGEFVVNAAATSQNRALLEAMNSGAIPGFANGGFVGLSAPVIHAPVAARTAQPIVVQNFDLSGAMVDKDVWANVNQIASSHASAAGKIAVATALKPHVLGPAMDKAKAARGAKAF